MAEFLIPRTVPTHAAVGVGVGDALGGLHLTRHKYSDVLTLPRVMQFALRYEF